MLASDLYSENYSLSGSSWIIDNFMCLNMTSPTVADYMKFIQWGISVQTRSWNMCVCR